MSLWDCKMIVAKTSVFLKMEFYLSEESQKRKTRRLKEKKKSSCLGRWCVKNSLSEDRLVYKDRGVYWLGKMEKGKRMRCVLCLHGLVPVYCWCLLGVSSRRSFALRWGHVTVTSTVISPLSTLKWCVWREEGRELSSLSGVFLNKIPK